LHLEGTLAIPLALGYAAELDALDELCLQSSILRYVIRVKGLGFRFVP
jgi:hypothetical protein